MCADKIVLRVSGLVILVAVNVVHKETEYLLKGDVSCREGQIVELALYHGLLLLVEITLCVSLEHIDVHLDIVKVFVILGTSVCV